MTVRVVEWVDIKAPRQEVFEIILNLTRRLQLSPLWGLAQIEMLDSRYPDSGSRYRVTLSQGDGSQYDTIITENQAGRKFAYHLTAARGTEVTWLFQDTGEGMRLIYQEDFLADEDEAESFSQSVRQVVRDWLKNIKNYAELRGAAWRRLVRWGLDSFFLKLRKDQRQVVATLIFFQVMGFISFVMAALALGIAGLVN